MNNPSQAVEHDVPDESLPTYRGLEGAADACREMGVPGVTINALKYAVRRGELKPRTIGGAYYFSRASIRAWLAEE